MYIYLVRKQNKIKNTTTTATTFPVQFEEPVRKKTVSRVEGYSRSIYIELMLEASFPHLNYLLALERCQK